MKSIILEFPDRIEYHNEKGECHREDGPAIIFHNGNKYWCINANLHREDGSAVEWNNGDKSWYLNDEKFISKETWFDELIRLKLKRILDL
jgi:hypothetical protein